MIPFAVKVKGLDTENGHKARWVLSIDPAGERFLVSHDDKSLHWYPMSECTLFKVQNPDNPLPVIPVKMDSGGLIKVGGNDLRRQ